MRFKVNPEDFKVEEKVSLKVFDTESVFRVYRLTKRNWNTIDAIRFACEANKVPIEKLRYGGRKDRFAVTSQFITTPSDCDISYKRHNVLVDLVGYSVEPMSPKKISGNQFTVIIRDMSEKEADLFRDALLETSENGFINYYDEQRIGGGNVGSVIGNKTEKDGESSSAHFFAELLIKRQYERAVKMLLCNCHPEAPASVKKRKSNMASLWGNWNAIKDIAVESGEHEICQSLLKDDSVSGLLKILRNIPREEFGMYLSAYQSFIWNEVCSKLSRETTEILEIPTIGPDILPASESTIKTIHMILAKRGIRTSKLKLAEFKECGYFSSFMRATKVYPKIDEIIKNDDEQFKSCYKITTKFTLPAGSYATMLLKQISSNL